MKEEDNIHFTKQTKSGLFLCRILHRYCPVEESGEVVENCEGCKYIVRIGDKWVTDIKYFESINTCPYCMGTGKMDFSKDNPLCVSTCPYCEGEEI
jgi:hypothetical protein